MTTIDLSGIPVIDNHCHGIYRDSAALNLAPGENV
jgi:hypothetical protein